MALAKKYTGPTPSRMADALPAIAPVAPDMLRASVLPIWFQPKRRLSMTVGTLPASFVQPDSQIPPPPLGKFIFSTFPACYKARTTATVRFYPAVGQIFPDPMSALPLFADVPTAAIGQFWP